MTPDSKLVEAVADAIHHALGFDTPLKRFVVAERERMYEVARAALAAISASGEWWVAPVEPSETMINAMGKAQPLDGGRYDNAREWDRVYQLPRWRAARDAHLKDTGTDNGGS